MNAVKKKKGAVPEGPAAMALAEADWFELRRYLADSPPFVKGMKLAERITIARLCGNLAKSLGAVAK